MADISHVKLTRPFLLSSACFWSCSSEFLLKRLHQTVRVGIGVKAASIAELPGPERGRPPSAPKSHCHPPRPDAGRLRSQMRSPCGACPRARNAGLEACRQLSSLAAHAGGLEVTEFHRPTATLVITPTCRVPENVRRGGSSVLCVCFPRSWGTVS